MDFVIPFKVQWHATLEIKAELYRQWVFVKAVALVFSYIKMSYLFNPKLLYQGCVNTSYNS